MNINKKGENIKKIIFITLCSILMLELGFFVGNSFANDDKINKDDEYITLLYLNKNIENSQKITEKDISTKKINKIYKKFVTNIITDSKKIVGSCANGSLTKGMYLNSDNLKNCSENNNVYDITLESNPINDLIAINTQGNIFAYKDGNPKFYGCIINDITVANVRHNNNKIIVELNAEDNIREVLEKADKNSSIELFFVPKAKENNDATLCSEYNLSFIENK